MYSNRQSQAPEPSEETRMECANFGYVCKLLQLNGLGVAPYSQNVAGGPI